MPLMTPYIFLAPPLILASSEWAPTELCADKSLLQCPLHITCFLHWLLLAKPTQHLAQEPENAEESTSLLEPQAGEFRS